MALQKNYEHKGYTPNYWMIYDCSYNVARDRITGRIALYADEETRRENIENWLIKKPFRIADVSQLAVNLTDANTAKDAIGTIVYTEIKKLEDFSDAIDC